MLSSTQQQRHLEWAIQSPSLIASAGPFPDDDWFSSQPVPATVPELSPDKLGSQFEKLVHYWLEQHPEMHLHRANIQIHDGSRTIGEFDALVQNGNELEHWELAIKFYLLVGQAGNSDHWFGPNPTDTLGKKYRHLLDRQLQLSTQDAALDWLQKHQLEIEQTRGFVKGRLFHPLDAYLNQQWEVPSFVNPCYERGWWATKAEFEACDEFMQHGLVTLPKPDWMAPLAKVDAERISNGLETFDGTTSGTLHVALIDDSGDELSRGFIVSEAWLQDATQLSSRTS